MEKRGIEIDALAEIAQQVRDREAARLVEHATDGERTGRVGELGLRAGEASESGSQLAERRRMPGLADLRLCPAEIAGFEVPSRAPLVEPGRDVARGQRADQRVRELVRQHAVEARPTCRARRASARGSSRRRRPPPTPATG